MQRSIFDPALKQYSNAYRNGEPRFTDHDTGQAWHAARRAAISLVLSAIADSPWADNLVLRGSVLLRAWFGDAAREPGDLDFVVTPASWRIDEARTDTMFTGVARAAEAVAHRGDSVVRIDVAEAVSDDIWTYDRVPGRRLLLPWTSDGLPGGVVQMDFVFNEHLPVDPEPVLLPAAPGGLQARLNAATAELSLAWKLMWLLCDMHPQGKDLYDAVLLAEHTPLRFELLRQVLLQAEPSDGGRPVGQPEIAGLKHTVEWDHFVAEYPDVAASETEFVDRLAAALAPTFRTAESAGQQEGEYARHVRWLEPRIREYGELLHREGMRAVQEAMHAVGLPVLTAIVITRELLGSDRHSVEDARILVFDDPAWQRLADVYRRNGGWLDRELERL
ncbi:nucleotidyl transferase AbiEii/AbiGii toxin family protein [Streptomyces sp. NTH33]|uniref:nucleotidyl transferase AbiEii/AbiGii toxin family protein n=1 Tax=Streptomyces sp. NTH33 TaxID=1735453 RepID=UPI0021AC2674|nr:nucleotidyl transferase AbiEii/AbiGii toxin family protein [Streptomyces sp. NTH33]